MQTSLRRQLLWVWLLIGAAALAVAALLWALYRQTTAVRAAGATTVLARTCGDIASRIAGVQAPPGGSRLDATALDNVVLQLVLAQTQGVEGGVWSPAAGHLAYAYPTYSGSVTKTDVPAAEAAFIEATARAALHAGGTVQADRRADATAATGSGAAPVANREVLLLAACPLQGTDRDGQQRAAWVMTRVPAFDADRRLLAGAAALLVMVSASGVLLGAVLRRWSRALEAIETALADAGDTDAPTLPAPRYRELARLSTAVGGYAARMVEARRSTQTLATELGRHERLAALGRLTAAVAHEIRNPIATMRLTAENALASPNAPHPSQARPLQVMLDQIHRLDGVVEGLLTMVQPIRLHPERVALRAWLQRCADAVADAVPAGVTLTVEARGPDHWSLDPLHAARVLDNLLRNALQHTPAGGTVALSSDAADAGLAIAVCNDGPPIPAALQDRLFEPFATGRDGGTGLGLAQAREVALAHGGSLVHRRQADGAGGRTCFVFTVPAPGRWPAS